MSYSGCIAGLVAALGSVDGLSSVLDYAPTSIQVWPTVYCLLDSVPKSKRTGQVTVYEYRVLCRVVLKWQENEQAEAEMMPFVNSIPDAIMSDPHLGDALSSGLAAVDSMNAGWVTIGGVQCRSLDLYVSITEKY